MNRDLADVVRNQNPIYLQPNATLKEACEAMHRNRIGAVLVTGADGKLVGIFTGRDVVRCGAESMDLTTTRLENAMPPGLKAIDALRLMHDGGFRHVPIAEHGRPVGIVSRGDFRGLEHDRLDAETGLWERIA